jgi:hypothetical protein
VAWPARTIMSRRCRRRSAETSRCVSISVWSARPTAEAGGGAAGTARRELLADFREHDLTIEERAGGRFGTDTGSFYEKGMPEARRANSNHIPDGRRLDRSLSPSILALTGLWHNIARVRRGRRAQAQTVSSPHDIRRLAFSVPSFRLLADGGDVGRDECYDPIRSRSP